MAWYCEFEILNYEVEDAAAASYGDHYFFGECFVKTGN